MFGALQQHLTDQLAAIRAAGLYKPERVLTTPQQAHVGVAKKGAELISAAEISSDPFFYPQHKVRTTTWAWLIICR